MPSPETPGRRERKKAATRLALSEAAMRLFTARGFDDVTVREIADAADVSTTTLMKHFPTKEALVFDRDDEIERALIAAVAERPPSSSALDALHAFLRMRANLAVPARLSSFTKLVRATPALSDYWHRMWMRHAHALAGALARDLGRPDGDPHCVAMAHLVLEAAALSVRARDGAELLDATFAILARGWDAALSPGEHRRPRDQQQLQRQARPQRPRRDDVRAERQLVQRHVHVGGKDRDEQRDQAPRRQPARRR